MDLLIVAVAVLLLLIVIGVPVYFVLFGMAGRSWKGIKEHDKWKRGRK